MSYGRTVVAPNIGCFGELLGTGALGLYAAEGADSTEELARALVEVAARADSRVATGAAHLERARTFDWPTIARATAALYETA
jgi:glycosyltransferase involved in cell wall biosynthesis